MACVKCSGLGFLGGILDPTGFNCEVEQIEVFVRGKDGFLVSVTIQAPLNISKLEKSNQDHNLYFFSEHLSEELQAQDHFMLVTF